MGFIQMAAGFLGGIAAAAIGQPVLALGTVIPTLGLICLASFVWYKISTRNNPLRAPEEAIEEPLVEAAE